VDGNILDAHPLMRKAAVLVFRFAHKIIAQNSYQQTFLHRKGIPAEIIRSSLEDADYTGNSKQYHLWLARAEKWKRPELFIDFAAAYPAEKFTMVCPPFAETDPHYFQGLQQKAAAVPNLEWINSYVPFTQLNGFFSNAKTFVNTSISEGFPTTFIHAWQHGIPVLSLNVDPDELLQKEQTGFHCNDDMITMKAQFERLLSDPVLYEQASAHARMYFTKYHDSQKNSRLLYEYITA
jgi:glycosyltransferase involved in cell wall biosynthesis